MESIGIIGNYEKKGVYEVIARICAFFSAQGTRVIIENELNGDKCPAGAECADLDSLLKAKAVFVLGGDGTVLGAARKAALEKHAPPLVCINMGSLGFLAQNRTEDLDVLLEAFISDKLEISEHFLLELHVPGEAKNRTCLAMNEVVFAGCSGLSRVIDISLFVDSSHATTYLGDGLIVATASGSTAHSLSAGGPIMVPGTSALLVTPICPFTLSNRPLIVPSTSRIGVRSDKEIGVTVDGQEYFVLPKNTQARISLYPYGIKMAHTGEHDFFDLLKIKLKWRGNVLGG